MDETWANALGGLTAAVRAVETGEYALVALGDLTRRDDLLGELARGIEAMSDAIKTREADLRRLGHDAVQRMVVAAEYKDHRTLEHIARMSHYAGLLATRFGLPSAQVDVLRQAAQMHDVGKIAIPESILLKPGKLNEEEWATMRQHTEFGASILRDTMSELLRAGELIALSHHERWDGTGYPRGLAGEQIPLWGRICAIADVFDALTSERPYKRAYTVEEAFDIMREGRGTHFDPKLLDMFLGSTSDVLRIRRQHGG